MIAGLTENERKNDLKFRNTQQARVSSQKKYFNGSDINVAFVRKCDSRTWSPGATATCEWHRHRQPDHFLAVKSYDEQVNRINGALLSIGMGTLQRPVARKASEITS